MIAWALVGLLLGSLVILWTLSKARIYGLEEDLDEARDAAEAIEEEKGDLLHENRSLLAKVQEAQERNNNLRELLRRLEKDRRGLLDTMSVARGANVSMNELGQYYRVRGHPPITNFTPQLERLALARLGVDCVFSHPEDCDCMATCQLFLDLAAEHESAPGEGA